MNKQEALEFIKQWRDIECYPNLVCLTNILFLIEEIVDKKLLELTDGK